LEVNNKIIKGVYVDTNFDLKKIFNIFGKWKECFENTQYDNTEHPTIILTEKLQKLCSKNLCKGNKCFEFRYIGKEKKMIFIFHGKEIDFVENQKNKINLKKNLSLKILNQHSYIFDQNM
jgi:hypothetical protein